MESPYWQLEEETAGLGSWQAVRRLPSTIAPVVRIVWRAAPRQSGTILALQLLSGFATAVGLLSTTDVLSALLASGPSPSRVSAALPGLAVVAGAYTLRGGMEAAVSLAQAKVAPSVRRSAEERLCEAALGAEPAAFDDAAFHDRMHRARDRGLFHLERASTSMVELIGAAFAVGASAASLGVLHPVLLPVLLLSLLPDAWAVLRASRLGYAGMARAVSLHRRVRMMSDLATDRAAAAEIRACQAEPFVLGEYRAVADALLDQEVRVGVAQARARAVGRALTGVATAVMLVLLAVLLNAGWIPLAAGGTALIALRTSSAALTRLVSAANQLLEQGLYVSDYEAFLAEAAARPRLGGSEPAPESPGRITVEAVCFRYPGGSTRETPALTEIDLTVDPGQTIALVGANGSGKTTLAKVIAGLYQPTAGRVRWDGHDLRDLQPSSVADRIAMVLQEPVRWPHDAKTNVRIGRHDREDADGTALAGAAHRARADEVVAGLSQGWNTLLSRQFRGGQDLSGGQWQRLAIARGFYRDAPLLIWDEPTAALDATAEYEVFASLRRIAADRTVILITHRLASVRDADQIFLLHAGRIAEHGTHPELLARGGRYADMYALQEELATEDLLPTKR